MVTSFYTDLMAWYEYAAAPLPWRCISPDTYVVWVSEIMLQQTQVNTVIPYYNRFLTAYPDVHSLANAPLDDVLKHWEGLGYYSRARNLHKAANIIVTRMQGQFPRTADGLQELPGIGRYTAGAIASIVYGERVPVLDGNVIRVFARLIDLDADVTRSETQKRLWQQAEDWLPDENVGDYNQALMELGRTICKPKNPLCVKCPLQEYCRSYAVGTQAERPVKKKKAPPPHYNVAAGIIRNDANCILIVQRPNEGLLGGLWGFPGGKQQPGETLPETLKRELHEELAITVDVGALFITVKHAFTHFKITSHAYECHYIKGPPQILEVQAFAWIAEDDFDTYSFGKADRLIIAALEERRAMLF